MQPDDIYFDQARRVGAKLAWDRGQAALVEDFISEAVCGLLTEWPTLVDDYGSTPDMRIVSSAVKHRLIDWLRSEYGRHHRKPHADAVGLEYNNGHAFEIPDPVDVAGAGIDRHDEVTQIIDLIAMTVDDDHRAQTETICHMLADGCPLAEIGIELDVSESRASQLVAELGHRVRAHAYVRSELMSA